MSYHALLQEIRQQTYGAAIVGGRRVEFPARAVPPDALPHLIEAAHSPTVRACAYDAGYSPGVLLTIGDLSLLILKRHVPRFGNQDPFELLVAAARPNP